MENELEKVLESKFFCPSRFAQEIESLVIENNGMNYIDAIVHFCDQNSIDVESVPKLLSKPLKEKIKYEAMELNFSCGRHSFLKKIYYFRDLKIYT